MHGGVVASQVGGDVVLGDRIGQISYEVRTGIGRSDGAWPGPALPSDYAIGQDGKARFASYEAAVIVLTEHHLWAYTCVLNCVTGSVELEATHEFMLADVTSVATINGRLPGNDGAANGNLLRLEGPVSYNHVRPAEISVCQEFRITLTSGDAVTVNIGCHVNGTTMSDDLFRRYVTETVRAIRSTLRELKGPGGR